MGSKKSSKSSSVSGSAQAWAQPYAKAGASQIANTYQQYAGSTEDATAGLSGLSDRISENYAAGQPAADAGRDYYADAIAGRYLNNNPHINQMVGQMREGTTDAVTSRMALGGRYGSGVHQGVLARELSNSENQLRFNAYNQERGLQHQAAAGAQGAQAANAQLGLGGYAAQASAPYAGMSAYGGALGNLFSGGTQQQTTYSPNPIWGAVGAGMGALGSYFGAGGTFSDRRLKNIHEVLGTNEKGLTVYRYSYKRAPDQEFVGFMADEVRGKVPEAYIENFRDSGYAGVNYALTGSTKVVEDVRD